MEPEGPRSARPGAQFATTNVKRTTCSDAKMQTSDEMKNVCRTSPTTSLSAGLSAVSDVMPKPARSAACVPMASYLRLSFSRPRVARAGRRCQFAMTAPARVPREHVIQLPLPYRDELLDEPVLQRDVLGGEHRRRVAANDGAASWGSPVAVVRRPTVPQRSAHPRRRHDAASREICSQMGGVALAARHAFKSVERSMSRPRRGAVAAAYRRDRPDAFAERVRAATSQTRLDDRASRRYHSSLNILEREMLMISTYLDNLSTQAALIAGFIFATFSPISGAALPLKGTYYASAALTFGLMIYILVCATLTTSLGPTLALKGSDGSSMRTAVLGAGPKSSRRRGARSLCAANSARSYSQVEGMKDERRVMFWAFVFGTTGFMVTVLCLARRPRAGTSGRLRGSNRCLRSPRRGSPGRRATPWRPRRGIGRPAATPATVDRHRSGSSSTRSFWRSSAPASWSRASSGSRGRRGGSYEDSKRRSRPPWLARVLFLERSSCARARSSSKAWTLVNVNALARQAGHAPRRRRGSRTTRRRRV